MKVYLMFSQGHLEQVEGRFFAWCPQGKTQNNKVLRVPPERSLSA
jgi:hypothetical protein